ncbi:MAG: hypothetical protein KGN36_20275, partial [Acidobacteriota bacterium]|nr:hypothetical protein [Acidobacteriota bacterium]
SVMMFVVHQVRSASTMGGNRKQVVNDALREGLARLTSPAEPHAFRTHPVDLGNCYFPNLDNVWDVLDEVERNGTGR